MFTCLWQPGLAAALPEQALVVHDPDSGAVTGRRAPEGARASRAALAKRP